MNAPWLFLKNMVNADKFFNNKKVDAKKENKEEKKPETKAEKK